MINDPPAQIAIVTALVEEKMKLELEGLIDSKLHTAMHFAKGIARDEGGHSWFKSVLGRKAVHEIGSVVDAKQYRQWNRDMKMHLTKYDHSHAQDSKLTEDEINEANNREHLIPDKT